MRLIADTHTHTLASNHAYSTVMENIVAAREQGLLYMAMTEHGPKMPDAPHIWHCVNQWEVPSLYKGLNILHGIEVDVMDEDGTLDIDNRVLAGLEWVIASMHGPCFAPATEQEHTRAWMKVAENPHVDVIGHCGRGNYPFDHEKVIRAFKEYGKIVESTTPPAKERQPRRLRRHRAGLQAVGGAGGGQQRRPLRRQNRRVRPGGGAAGGSGFSKEADYQRGHRPL